MLSSLGWVFKACGVYLEVMTDEKKIVFKIDVNWKIFAKISLRKYSTYFIFWLALKVFPNLPQPQLQISPIPALLYGIHIIYYFIFVLKIFAINYKQEKI